MKATALHISAYKSYLYKWLCHRLPELEQGLTYLLPLFAFPVQLPQARPTPTWLARPLATPSRCKFASSLRQLLLQLSVGPTVGPFVHPLITLIFILINFELQRFCLPGKAEAPWLSGWSRTFLLLSLIGWSWTPCLCFLILRATFRCLQYLILWSWICCLHCPKLSSNPQALL